MWIGPGEAFPSNTKYRIIQNYLIFITFTIHLHWFSIVTGTVGRFVAPIAEILAGQQLDQLTSSHEIDGFFGFLAPGFPAALVSKDLLPNGHCLWGHFDLKQIHWEFKPSRSSFTFAFFFWESSFGLAPAPAPGPPKTPRPAAGSPSNETRKPGEKLAQRCAVAPSEISAFIRAR